MKAKHQRGGENISDGTLKQYFVAAKSAKDLTQSRLDDQGLQLLEAAALGDEDKVLSLISEGADVHFKNAQKLTAGNYAIRNGHATILKILIENNIVFAGQRHIGNVFGSTPLLHEAITAGEIEMVRMLFSVVAKIMASSPGDDFRKVFHGAWINARTGRGIAMMQMLFDISKHCDGTVFLESQLIDDGLHENHIRLVAFNEQDVNRQYGAYGATMIHFAALCDESLLHVHELLSRGYNINSKDFETRTPLSYALGRSPYKLHVHWLGRSATKELLKNGATISPEDWAVMSQELRAQYGGQRDAGEVVKEG
jgi:ankyrin repeat protein